MRDIREDNLGDYLVCNSVGDKPTTIQYFARCPECERKYRFTGSLDTRKYTLRNRKSFYCWDDLNELGCKKIVNLTNTKESIGQYYEMKDFIESLKS